MEQSKIIIILFSLTIIAFIYAVFGESIYKSKVIYAYPISKNYAETDVQNKNTHAIYYSDDLLTTSTDYLTIEESHDTSTDNPHLPIAYEIKPHQINPELEQEEDDTKKEITSYLEAGQSRTFLYPSTGVYNINLGENENIDEYENSNDGYFLQPGQSRTFFAKHKANDYIPDAEPQPH